VMSREVELASYTREATVRRKKDLLRNPEDLGRRIGFIRKDYVR